MTNIAKIMISVFDRVENTVGKGENPGKIMISLFDRVENTVGKGENPGCQHFPLFPQFFPGPSSLESVKVGIVRKRVKMFTENHLYLKATQADYWNLHAGLLNYME